MQEKEGRMTMSELRAQMQFTNEQQRFIDEHYQLLPKDADGEVIHIGDVMWQKGRITKRACKAIMGDAYVMLDGIQGAVYAKGLTHYHAPTVEDVLQKLLEQAVGYSDAHTTVALNAIAECAAKLRLADIGVNDEA